MGWKKMLSKNLTKAEDLLPFLPLLPEEQAQLSAILQRYPMSVTPYYLSLIDWSDPEDPIRKMSIPSFGEDDVSGMVDTSGEQQNTIMTGMQHKYGETALVLSTNLCAMYCRHCFRKRLVGVQNRETVHEFEKILAYVQSTPEISNVLISGGDALLNDTATIGHFLEKLTEIPHLDLIRFGTRTPVVFPTRITEDAELLSLLAHYQKKKQIYFVTQFNHPREFTPEALAAVHALTALGIVVKNQTVLMRGINDNPDTLTELLRGITRHGMVPYYVFQCRPVAGVKNQFQIPLWEGSQIVEAARARQNGQGKCFRYCLSHEKGKIEILGPAGEDTLLFKFHQAKIDADENRIFTEKMQPGQCWL